MINAEKNPYTVITPEVVKEITDQLLDKSTSLESSVDGLANERLKSLLQLVVAKLFELKKLDALDELALIKKEAQFDTIILLVQYLSSETNFSLNAEIQQISNLLVAGASEQLMRLNLIQADSPVCQFEAFLRQGLNPLSRAALTQLNM